MKVFLAAVVFVGLCVLGLGFNIFFRKNGHFPDTEIESNPAMRKLGIKCAKQEEIELWQKNGARRGSQGTPATLVSKAVPCGKAPEVGSGQVDRKSVV